MKNSKLLTTLAITAGLLAVVPAFALEEMKPDSTKAVVADTTAKPVKKKKAKKVVVADSTAKTDTTKAMPAMADTTKPKMHMKHDSTMHKAKHDTTSHKAMHDSTKTMAKPASAK